MMMDSVSRLLFVMLVGISCVVQTMALGCLYSDSRCSCDGSVKFVTCTDLDQIPPLNTSGNVTEVTSLTFQGGNITSISRSSLPLGLTRMIIIGNPLTNMPDDAFDAIAATLQTLYIEGAKFSNLPKTLKKVTNLTQLSIVDTAIQDWDTATLKQLGATVQHLYLRNVSLSSWPSWISDFPLLRTLDLSLNNLSSVPDNAFIFVKDTLTKLVLSNTNLTHVPKGLSTLSNVTALTLEKNNFTDVSEFQYITGSVFAEKLGYLNLQSVGLTRMLNISNFTNLAILFLNKNRISDVPVGSFPKSLRSVYFDRNSLSSVPKDFASMPNLDTLELNYNTISEIEPDSFPSSLTILNLDFNNITTITNTTFKNLNLLNSLYLSYNPIATISPEAFSDLVSLKFLAIQNSHLREIPLAVTKLNADTVLLISTTEPLSCPCPAPQELVQWTASFRNTYGFFVKNDCDDGQKALDYLNGQCGQSSATA